VSRASLVQRVAEWFIRAACRRLPAGVRAERCREWAAELPAILDDQAVRPPFRRALRALRFCAGISRTTRQLRRSARASARRAAMGDRFGRAPARQREYLARRAVLGFLVWLVVVSGAIAVISRHPGPPGWPVMLLLALAVGFDAFCLADIARAAQVRCLPKWAWVLICLAQTPAGGIAYLSIGHVRRERPVPPGEAKP
jgi:hypothetical protein